MRNINFGFIGCGWIIQKTYLPILKQMKDVTLLSIYDVDNTRAESCAANFGIKQVCSTVDEFLNTLVDVVIIATPNYTHKTYIRKAIMKNKHVICEKPIVFHSIDYMELQEEARKRGCLLIPAFVNEFRSEIMALHKVVDGGVIGNICSVESGWIRTCGYPSLGSWFTHKEYAGGGVLMDLGPHVLDISLSLFDHHVEIVDKKLETWYEKFDSTANIENSAQWYNNEKRECYDIDVETSMIGHVVYHNKQALKVKLSWNAPVDHDETYIFMNGEKGRIELTTLFGFSTNRKSKVNKLQLYPNTGESQTIIFDDVMNEQMKSFKRLCKFIIGCIRGDESPNKFIENGRKVVELTEQLYEKEIIKQSAMEDFVIG